MLVFIDQRTFFLGRRSPQQKYRSRTFGADQPDCRIGYSLPAVLLMGIGLVGANRQHGVQQQHALAGPAGQTAGLRCRAAEVIGQFFVNIAQRGRNFNAVRNGKGQAVCLKIVMVRILAQNDRLDRVRLQRFEGGKTTLFRRKDRMLAALLLNERRQRLQHFRRHQRVQTAPPARRQPVK